MTIVSASSGSVRPIESRSVSEQVTNELRRSILAGALPPGQSLSLRKLAEQLEVSFIPVRDALRVLESTLIGGEVSSQTNQLIHKQIDQANQENTNPNDMLNLLTALVMGSPEFQLR